jgi:hypothetical protein
MVCSIVEGGTGFKGRMNVRRQERVAPLSDSQMDGRDGVAFIACELEADQMSLQDTGETLMIQYFNTRNSWLSHEQRTISASESSKCGLLGSSTGLDGGEDASLTVRLRVNIVSTKER